MSKGRGMSAREIEMAGILNGEGTIDEGSKAIVNLGGTFYASIPQPYARIWGVEVLAECETYVDVDERIVIHRIPEDDGTE